jgi:hypothetical protein
MREGLAPKEKEKYKFVIDASNTVGEKSNENVATISLQLVINTSYIQQVH